MAPTWTKFSASPGQVAQGGSSSFTYTNTNGGVSIPAGSTAVLAIITLDEALAAAPTLGGNAMTLVNSSGTIFIYYLDCATSVGDTLAFTLAAAAYEYNLILLAYVTGVATGGPSSYQDMVGGTEPETVTLTIPAGGTAFVANIDYLGSNAAAAPTWTNATGLDFNGNNADWGQIATAANTTSSGSTAITALPPNVDNANMSGAAWAAGATDVLYPQIVM